MNMGRRKKAAGRWEWLARRPGFWKRAGIVAAAFVVIPVAVVTAIFVFRAVDTPGPPRAAIVDQLSLTAPNPDFARQVRELLEPVGYQVDYYPGEQVTVDFYRELPKRGYDLVLMRAHAGLREEAPGEFTDEVSLFTSERYTTTSYVQEQRDGRVTMVLYGEEDSEAYFGIPAAFVRHSMKGRFDGATVILMGCDVLRGKDMAEAFVWKGAQAVVGWDGPVSADHTDTATLSLLRHYFSEGLSVQEAAAAAMDEVGPDPYYGARFLSEPPQASR